MDKKANALKKIKDLIKGTKLKKLQKIKGPKSKNPNVIDFYDMGDGKFVSRTNLDRLINRERVKTYGIRGATAGMVGGTYALNKKAEQVFSKYALSPKTVMRAAGKRFDRIITEKNTKNLDDKTFKQLQNILSKDPKVKDKFVQVLNLKRTGKTYKKLFPKSANERKYTTKQITNALEKADINKPKKHNNIITGAGLAGALAGGVSVGKNFSKLHPALKYPMGALAGIPSYFLAAIPTALTIDKIKSKKMENKGFERAWNGRVNYIPKKYLN